MDQFLTFDRDTLTIVEGSCRLYQLYPGDHNEGFLYYDLNLLGKIEISLRNGLRTKQRAAEKYNFSNRHIYSKNTGTPEDNRTCFI